MRTIPTKYGGYLRVWQKGESGNPKGRPKKIHPQFTTTQTYKMSEINDTIQYIVGMNEEQLQKVIEDNNATILEKTVANALRRSLSKGRLDSLETLLDRVYGKPGESVDITSNGEGLNNKIQIEIVGVKKQNEE